MKTSITLFSLILVLPLIVSAQFKPHDSYSPYEMHGVQVSTPGNENVFTFQKSLFRDESRFEFDSLNVSYQGSWALGQGISISCNGPGNIVFVGAGAGVIVLDVSTPSSPVELGEIHTRGLVDAIYFDEITNRLYLCAYFSGFEIWDVSNFSAPVRLGRGSTEGLPRGGIFASGNYVYVVTVANGVQVFDVSNPSSPINTGNCPLSTTNFAWNSAKSGNYIFVAIGNGGLKVVDVSNPANPHIVGNSNYLATGVWVANGYAYIVAYNFGMRILNISNLSNITQTGYKSLTGYPYRITVVNNYAYIANATTDMSGGINVVDISTPASPQLISTYTGYAEYVTGNGQMVAFTGGGLPCSILDISNPINPVLANAYPLPSSTIDVAVSGNYAYSASNGFRVFDISDKTHPVQVGYDSNDGGLIELAGDKAVYIRQSMTANNPVMIMDISNPATPTKVGEYMAPVMTYDLAVKDHYAFVACWWDGFRVIDFQDPANPVLVAHKLGWFNGAVPGDDYCYAQALDVEGNYAYIIDYNPFEAEDTRGLYIFDISDPTNPIRISRYKELLSDGNDIDVVGDFAYIADKNGGMEVIDVTIKQNPQSLGYISLPDSPSNIKVSENHAFIADYINGGVQVVNVTDPNNLTIDGYYTRSGCFALGVRVNSNNIYLADGPAGFQIYQTNLISGSNFSLSGTITYPNTAHTPLAGITLNLKNAGGTVIASTTSNASGNYSFTNLTNGAYTLEPSVSKAWGGVSAADALLYKKHIANIAPLVGIFLASGDVNASGSLTASDVLLIKKRIAFITNSFAVGDWLFNNIPVTINGGNATLDFNGLCFGDANGSYNPPAKGN